MDQLRGQAHVVSAASMVHSNGTAQRHAMNGWPVSSRQQFVMSKLAGERSFGMTLEQNSDALASDYPRISYVFPNSPASRAGLCAGWKIVETNGVQCAGRKVADVASIFRGLAQVTMLVDTATTGISTAPAVTSAFPSAATTPSLPIVPPAIPAQVNPPRVVAAPTVNASMTPVANGLPHAPSSSVSAATVMSIAAQVSLITPTPTPPQLSASPPRPVMVVAPMPTVRQAPPVQQQPAAGPVQVSAAPVQVPAALPVNPTTAPPQHPPPTANGCTSSSSAHLPVAPQPPVSHAPPTPPVLSPPAQALPISSVAALPAASAVSSATTTTNPIQSPPSPQPQQVRSSGKKRGRVQLEHTASRASVAIAATTPTPTPKKRGRPAKRRTSTANEYWDSDDAVFFYGSDHDVEEVTPPPANTTRGRRSSRQAENGGRTRRSLTVSRLMTMGFTQEDAEASVEACGQDADKCMVWIVAHIEEKNYLNDLNKASIESEQQKRVDAEEQKKKQSETVQQTTAFTSLFPKSFILCDQAEAPRVQSMLSETIGNIAGDTLVRTLLTKLLTVESKAIRWYKDAAKCYMLQLAARLEIAFASHDVATCCSRVMASQPLSEACSFVCALQEEESALSKALFCMPENHGGVPVEFLHADDSMQFSLDDDGFEVVEMPPSAASP